MVRRGGGGRPAGGPTLGQATGGRPGQVKGPTARPLGLGLGLNAHQRGAFQQAVQGGGGGQYLAAHPGIQQRIGQVSQNTMGGRLRGQRIQNFMGTGQSQAPMPRPPQGQPQRGTQRPPQQPQTMSALPNYGVNPGMQSVLASRMSQAPQPQQSMDYRFPQQQGYTGDGAGMQSQLGQQSTAGQDYGYANPNYNYGGQSSSGFQQAPSQTFNPQQQQGRFGGAMTIGGGYNPATMGPPQSMSSYGGMPNYGNLNQQQPSAPGTPGNMGWFGGQQGRSGNGSAYNQPNYSQQARPQQPGFGGQYGGY